MSMKFNTTLPSPTELKEEYPLSEKLAELKKKRDQEIRDIFTGIGKYVFSSMSRMMTGDFLFSEKCHTGKGQNLDDAVSRLLSMSFYIAE